MDIEQLKLILEALQGAGQTSVLLAMIWLFRPYVGMVLGTAFGFYAMNKVIKLILQVVRWNEVERIIKRELGISGCLVDSEIKQIVDTIRKGKEA